MFGFISVSRHQIWFNTPHSRSTYPYVRSSSTRLYGYVILDFILSIGFIGKFSSISVQSGLKRFSTTLVCLKRSSKAISAQKRSKCPWVDIRPIVVSSNLWNSGFSYKIKFMGKLCSRKINFKDRPGSVGMPEPLTLWGLRWSILCKIYNQEDVDFCRFEFV